MYLWTIPLVLLTQAYYLSGVTDSLDELWVRALPFLAEPSYMQIRSIAEPAVGQWWLLGLFAVLVVFNYLLGEELIFRGILLPKMNGVFGKWDWLANGILFSLYHVHKPSSWPSTLLIDWIYPWAAKTFKSYWVAVILHAADALLIFVLVTLGIMGMAD
jgi:membrane protease YdiL (CAAX protease family)